MSSTIIVLIIVLLTTLLAYAFVSQAMEQRRKRRQRLLAALKQRSANFRLMIDSFPSGFLTRELDILVHQCLVDVTRQLLQLEGKSGAQREELSHHSQQLEAVKRQARPEHRPSLQTPHQIREVRALLQDFANFIAQQHQKGALTKQQFQLYEADIRHLILQVTVDSHLLSAQQAEGSDKDRLAAHYYSLAFKLLARENKSGNYQQQIAEISQKLQAVEHSMAEKAPDSTLDTNDVNAEEVSREWQQFDDVENSVTWKKKSLYD